MSNILGIKILKVMTLFYCILLIVIAICIIVSSFYFMLKQEDKKREIAVYSGSFDPLHIGHKAILDEISKIYDWVYLIITPQNPLKKRKSSNIDDRLKMAHDALLRHELFNVTVNNIERDMLPPYYTIKTLDELKKQAPHNNFTLIIGADNLQQIREWKEYQRLLIEYGVLVFPRGDINVSKLEDVKHNLLGENPSYKIQISKILIPNISSTEIRNSIDNGNEDIKNLLM